jgi:uncharacterized protein YecA (UPF0149 family)
MIPDPIPLEETHPFLADVFADIAQKKYKYGIHYLHFDGKNINIVQRKGVNLIKQTIRCDDVGRNEPCPCGAKGKKYKHCCGRI